MTSQTHFNLQDKTSMLTLCCAVEKRYIQKFLSQASRLERNSYSLLPCATEVLSQYRETLQLSRGERFLVYKLRMTTPQRALFLVWHRSASYKVSKAKVGREAELFKIMNTSLTCISTLQTSLMLDTHGTAAVGAVYRQQGGSP